jgi:hypothetical protein
MKDDFHIVFFGVFFRLDSNSSSNEVIEALKTKLKDKDSDQKSKCLICMVSIVLFVW